jgi:thiosulfate/3-mercaptopyruvate sulfurtransferase
MFRVPPPRFRLLAFVIVGLIAAALPSRAAEPLVTPDWVAAHLADPRVVVLDVRPAVAFAGGHIPRAVAADFATADWRVARPDGAAGALPPIGQIGAMIAAIGVDDADHAVIVGDDFAAAARVYWTFKVLGHAEGSILDGGFRAWPGALERGSAGPRPGAIFMPRYDATLRAELGEVAAAAGTGAMVLVDARPLVQFRGAGHLPGAVSVDQSAILAEDGRVKSPAVLAGLFAPVGGKPAIVYCNTGHLGAADWFVLSEILHHRGAMLYDGSMSQWTADPRRPVVR